MIILSQFLAKQFLDIQMFWFCFIWYDGSYFSTHCRTFFFPGESEVNYQNTPLQLSFNQHYAMKFLFCYSLFYAIYLNHTPFQTVFPVCNQRFKQTSADILIGFYSMCTIIIVIHNQQRRSISSRYNDLWLSTIILDILHFLISPSFHNKLNT